MGREERRTVTKRRGGEKTNFDPREERQGAEERTAGRQHKAEFAANGVSDSDAAPLYAGEAIVRTDRRQVILPRAGVHPFLNRR